MALDRRLDKYRLANRSDLVAHLPRPTSSLVG